MKTSLAFKSRSFICLSRSLVLKIIKKISVSAGEGSEGMSIETKEVIFELPAWGSMAQESGTKAREIKIMVVKDIEALVTNPDDEDNIPYWADIWPAARPMSQYIWEHIDFNGAEVMELGAGVGLPGIVAGLKGGKVTFSDYKKEALEVILFNAKANGVENVDTYLGDWRNFTMENKFDWILGSDILYNPRLNPYAEKILLDNLKEDGHLLISHARRPVTYEALERLKKAGSFKEKVNTFSVTIEDPYFPNYLISLHHLFRKG